MQREQSDEANLPFENMQPGPGASVVKPDAVRMALKGAGCGIFVPQDKSRLPSMLVSVIIISYGSNILKTVLLIQIFHLFPLRINRSTRTE